MIPLLVTLSLLAAPEANQEGIEFFEKKIRPVLVGECYSCHSSEAKDLKGSLRLDSRPGVRQGGATAAAVVPGNVSKSLLIAAIRREGLKMPPDKSPMPKNMAASAAPVSSKNWPTSVHINPTSFECG